MAINPHLPNTVTNSSHRQRDMKRVSQAEFTLPPEKPPAGVGMEKATRDFGLALQQLSPADKVEIQKIQSNVDAKHANDSAKRFGRLLVGVMDYSHRRLSYLEQNRGTAKPGECEGLEKVFVNGMNLVEAFAALPD